jgi:hypothetical protein
MTPQHPIYYASAVLKIAEVVGRLHGVSRDDLIYVTPRVGRPCETYRVTIPRQIWLYIARNILPLTNSSLALITGRNRKGIMYNLGACEAARSNPRFEAELQTAIRLSKEAVREYVIPVESEPSQRIVVPVARAHQTHQTITA